jgi:F420-dependent methylenetetrahydromethanopterin dehydrogenase
MSWNPLHPDCLKEGNGSNFLQRVLRPDLAWSPEHCPLLVLLASPGENCDERLIEESEEYALGEVLYEKRYVCGWMSASLDPQEMATWIAELCKNQTGRNCASV